MKHRAPAVEAMQIQAVEVGEAENGYQPAHLRTDRGTVALRHYPVPGTRQAAVWVGGVGGDWDSPARGLYPRLCEALTQERIASLRVRFRRPGNLTESVLDVLAGPHYLEQAGVTAVALTGHSFGGAVVIQAAAAAPRVRTVVALATQSYGAAPAATLAPRCSLLLIHGTADEVLPPCCAQSVYALAGEPKRLVLYEGAGHVLDEVAAQVEQVVHAWIGEQLSRAGPTVGGVQPRSTQSQEVAMEPHPSGGQDPTLKDEQGREALQEEPADPTLKDAQAGQPRAVPPPGGTPQPAAGPTDATEP